MKYIKLFENYEERFDKIEKALHRVDFRLNDRPLVIIGTPGDGKLYSTKKILDDMDYEYSVIDSGRATPTEFYFFLYDNRESVVVIDESSVDNRIIKMMTQLCRGENITHPYPFAPNPPDTIMQFEFTGKVVVLSPDLTHSPKCVDNCVDTIFLGFK